MNARCSRAFALCLLSSALLPLAQAQPVETGTAIAIDLQPHVIVHPSPAGRGDGGEGAGISQYTKLLLIEFFSYKTMDSKVSRDLIINSGPTSEVIKTHYQLISIEQGKEPVKEIQYKITRFPTLIIAQPDGTEIDRIDGLRRPSEVEATLKAAATGQSEIARARERATAPGAGIREHMTLATALRLRGDREGAFKEYLWILDHGEIADPKAYSSMFRLLIQQIFTLSKDYLPAMEELKKRQAAIASAATAGTATPQAITRIFIMNDVLGNASGNVPLFIKIPANSPLKRSLFSSVFPELVRAGKYKEAAEVTDLEDYIISLYPQARYAPGHHAHDGHNHKPPAPTPAVKQRIATHAAAACETLIALGQMEKAKRVAGRTLDYLGTDNRSLIAQLNTVAAKLNVQAGDFPAWLKSYSQPSQPPKSESP